MLLISLATIFGILLDTCFPLDQLARFHGNLGFHLTLGHGWWATVVLCLLLLIRARPSVRRVVAVLIFVPLGGWLHHHQTDLYQHCGLGHYLRSSEQPTVIRGIVDRPPILCNRKSQDDVGRPHRSPWQTQMEVRVTELRVGQFFRRSEGRVLIMIEGQCTDLLPGDGIEAYGNLCRFDAPGNPGQRDLRPHYRYRNLQAKFKVADPRQIIRRPGTLSWQKAIHRWIASFAARGRDELLQHTSNAAGPLAVAMVLGQRDYIDHATSDLLLVTGTAHLLSVSGMHLAILVVLANILATLARLPLRLRIIWILLFCLFYTSLTGGRPPVIRAAVLVGVYLLSVWLRRMNQPVNTLSVAALVLIFINPGNVLSVGVHLSFLAVLTLITCARKVAPEMVGDEGDAQQRRLNDLIDSGRNRVRVAAEQMMAGIYRLFRLSGCVTAVCMPLVWYHFHVVSPISVLVNLLLAPCLLVALVSGLLVIVTGLFHDSLAIIPGWICSKTLEWMQGVMLVAADVPLGHYWLPAPPGYWVITFYVFLVGTFFIPWKKNWHRRSRHFWIVIWIPVAYFLATHGRTVPEDTLEATFLDVGHGTCVVLRMPSNEVWVYDCGRLGNESYSSAGIDHALWSMGITRLDGIILSHADADHFNALPGILKRFQVGCVITPPGMLSEPESALLPIQQSIRHYGIDVQEVHHDRGRDGIASLKHLGLKFPTSVEVLHPPLSRVPGSDNANSLVFHLRWGGKSMILPGDLEPPGTARVVNLPRPEAGGILMAPHHGSLRMDAASVLQWARPQETMVSGGARASKPEVQEMLSMHGSEVHVTAITGAIRVQIGKEGKVRVQEWNCEGW